MARWGRINNFKIAKLIINKKKIATSDWIRWK